MDATKPENAEPADKTSGGETREQRVSAQAAQVRALYPKATGWQIAVLGALSVSQFAVWKALAEHGRTKMCRACLQDAVDGVAQLGNNGSWLLRDLRQRGLTITRGRRATGCSTHEGTATWQCLEDPLPDPSRFTSRALYTANEWNVIRRVLGNRDAFTGSGAVDIEIDHRVPLTRTSGAEERVDVHDSDAVTARYMGLTREHNTTKREKCRSCVETGQRPAFLGIPIWFRGGQTFDPAIGCDGCGWAYPERWKASVVAACTTGAAAGQPGLGSAAASDEGAPSEGAVSEGAGCTRRTRKHCAQGERSTPAVEARP